jgi:hypothetical protein
MSRSDSVETRLDSLALALGLVLPHTAGTSAITGTDSTAGLEISQDSR